MGKRRTTSTKKKATSTPSDPKAEQPLAAKPMTPRPAGSEEIRDRAYRLWEAAGKPPGDGAQFWFEAEKELQKRVLSDK